MQKSVTTWSDKPPGGAGNHSRRWPFRHRIRVRLRKPAIRQQFRFSYQCIGPHGEPRRLDSLESLRGCGSVCARPDSGATKPLPNIGRTGRERTVPTVLPNPPSLCFLAPGAAVASGVTTTCAGAGGACAYEGIPFHCGAGGCFSCCIGPLFSGAAEAPVARYP